MALMSVRKDSSGIARFLSSRDSRESCNPRARWISRRWHRRPLWWQEPRAPLRTSWEVGQPRRTDADAAAEGEKESAACLAHQSEQRFEPVRQDRSHYAAHRPRYARSSANGRWFSLPWALSLGERASDVPSPT